MKALFLSALILWAADARASAIYTVTLDTSDFSFSATPPGPLSLAFQFADGSGSGDGNNSVTLSDFQFFGGGPTGLPFLSGSLTGDLSSGITFTDANPTSVFFQGFTAGFLLSFQISLTTNVDSGGIPDEFIMSLLDATLSPIPTTSTSPLYPLLAIDFDSSNPTVSTFGSTCCFPAPQAGGFIFFDAPIVTLDAPPVPEPTSALLSVIPLAWIVWYRRRRTS